MVPLRIRAIFLGASRVGIAAILLAAPVHAQSGGKHTRGVAGAGISFAGDGPETRGGPGLAGHVGVRHQRGRYVFTVRAGMNGGGAARTTTPGVLIDRFDELALMAGYAVHRSETAQAVLSTGLAAVAGERVVTREWGTGAESFHPRVGVPVQLALSSPGASAGFGLVVHANFNPEEAFGAVTVTYLFGFDS